MAYSINSEEYMEEMVEQSIKLAVEELGLLSDTVFPASLIAQFESTIEEFEGWEEFLLDSADDAKADHGDWLYQQMKDGDM